MYLEEMSIDVHNFDFRSVLDLIGFRGARPKSPLNVSDLHKDFERPFFDLELGQVDHPHVLHSLHLGLKVSHLNLPPPASDDCDVIDYNGIKVNCDVISPCEVGGCDLISLCGVIDDDDLLEQLDSVSNSEMSEDSFDSAIMGSPDSSLSRWDNSSPEIDFDPSSTSSPTSDWQSFESLSSSSRLSPVRTPSSTSSSLGSESSYSELFKTEIDFPETDSSSLEMEVTESPLKPSSKVSRWPFSYFNKLTQGLFSQGGVLSRSFCTEKSEDVTSCRRDMPIIETETVDQNNNLKPMIISSIEDHFLKFEDGHGNSTNNNNDDVGSNLNNANSNLTSMCNIININSNNYDINNEDVIDYNSKNDNIYNNEDVIDYNSKNDKMYIHEDVIDYNSKNDNIYNYDIKNEDDVIDYNSKNDNIYKYEMDTENSNEINDSEDIKISCPMFTDECKPGCISLDADCPCFCQHCPEEFSDEIELYLHIAEDHVEIRPFRCLVCCLTYYTKMDRFAHLKQHHSDHLDRVLVKSRAGTAVAPDKILASMITPMWLQRQFELFDQNYCIDPKLLDVDSLCRQQQQLHMGTLTAAHKQFLNVFFRLFNQYPEVKERDFISLVTGEDNFFDLNGDDLFFLERPSHRHPNLAPKNRMGFEKTEFCCCQSNLQSTIFRRLVKAFVKRTIMAAF